MDFDKSETDHRPARTVVSAPKRTIRIALGALAGIGLLAAVLIVGGHLRSNAEDQKSASGEPLAGPADHAGPTVRVVRPKLNRQELVRSITQPAFIEALYRADLMSHVAGEVKFIEKDIGDSITKGEVLIEIHAPDLAKAVEQKAALVAQARQDLRSAEANVKVMEASEKSARSAVAEKEANIDRDEAKQRFLDAELARFNELAKKDAVLANIIDEKKLEAESAAAAVKASRAAVATAKNEAERAAAKLSEAKVDVDVRQSRVAVSLADKEQAEAQFEFSKIRAPFDGTIIDRNVDPGAFVQNASTGKPTALLSVVKIDKVTAVMWVPEREAPFVTKDTEAVLKLDALKGREIHTKVDRLSNWLDPEHSRDMRVEIDIKNAASKDNSDPPIRPGMYGSLTLLLQRFEKAHLLPAGAVFQREKKTCIVQVQDGVAHVLPVRVDFEDGATSIVSKLVGRDSAGKETHAKLAGGELIVASGQGEIADGERVNAVEVAW